ncbi:hypothetical protein RJ639_009239 [Escallonia herrerae]|uniref:Glu-AdT subunit C n=1 Tax=Escallonia herrerae TaxID=1293975 RepID=A0AA89AUX7_9ASTE|nr:hypothetical protein RJ639_009239 [Escallonia herrerae]
MGSRGIMGMLRGAATAALPVNHHHSCPFSLATTSFGYGLLLQEKSIGRTYSARSARSALEPPDLSRLAQTARISLTPQEVFGQLQAVDLQSIEPAIRADTEGDNLRDDLPDTFENRQGEAMIAAVPSYEDPYIKVPKVLNKE